MTELFVGGMGQGELVDSLERTLRAARPRAVGIASAFVSVSGVERVLQLLTRCGARQCHLIAGTDFAITHPEALTLAQSSGWDVRIGTSGGGVFHPKLIVAGEAFTRQGSIKRPACFYIGSANVTDGGFARNVESSLFSDQTPDAIGAARAFLSLWRVAIPLEASMLRNYSALFAGRNRSRSVDVLTALGISDEDHKATPTPSDLHKRRPPKRSSFGSHYAAEVWAELKSFTGAYTFQVEFPRSAGEVLQRLVGSTRSPKPRVDVECEDGRVYAMTYRYYTDNSMYRLNIPGTVPGVAWARAHKTGVAVVRRGPEGGPPISLRIVPPGKDMENVIARSVALSSWGRTTTRLYGWY